MLEVALGYASELYKSVAEDTVRARMTVEEAIEERHLVARQHPAHRRPRRHVLCWASWLVLTPTACDAFTANAHPRRFSPTGAGAGGPTWPRQGRPAWPRREPSAALTYVLLVKLSDAERNRGKVLRKDPH